jgi:hypothetical protein
MIRVRQADRRKYDKVLAKICSPWICLFYHINPKRAIETSRHLEKSGGKRGSFQPENSRDRPNRRPSTEPMKEQQK